MKKHIKFKRSGKMEKQEKKEFVENMLDTVKDTLVSKIDKAPEDLVEQLREVSNEKVSLDDNNYD